MWLISQPLLQVPVVSNMPPPPNSAKLAPSLRRLLPKEAPASRFMPCLANLQTRQYDNRR